MDAFVSGCLHYEILEFLFFYKLYSYLLQTFAIRKYIHIYKWISDLTLQGAYPCRVFFIQDEPTNEKLKNSAQLWLSAVLYSAESVTPIQFINSYFVTY